MTAARGYYSIMQYCPDASRGEAANVGVVLFCPERNFLAAKVAEGNDRIARFFGRSSFDAVRVNHAKQAIANRLHSERERFRTLEDWMQFVETRANDIVLTAPRPMKVLNPTVDLEELFTGLVGGRQTRPLQERSQLGAHLKTLFNRDDLKAKILRNEKVSIPITGTLLKAPYAFKNGVLNLVRPLPMTGSVLTEAHKLAIDGDLLNKHSKEMGRPAKLLVAIATPETPERVKERETVEKLFTDYHLTYYVEEELDKLAYDVETALH